MEYKTARVIIFSQSRQVDKFFDYAAPKAIEETLSEGMRVVVPFGGSDKKTEGVIFELYADEYEHYKTLKPIYNALDDYPIFSPHMLKLAQFMAKRYAATVASCLSAIMPTGGRLKTTWAAKLADENALSDAKLTPKETVLADFLKQNGGFATREDIERKLGKNYWQRAKSLQKKGVASINQLTDIKTNVRKEKRFYINVALPDFYPKYQKLSSNERAKSQKAVLDYLTDGDGKTAAEIQKNVGVTASPIKTLVKNGFLLQKEEIVYGAVESAEKIPLPTLNAEQKTAVDVILQSDKPTLLFGVTGSGKTEVYIKAIESVIKEGKQAIALVPEISLTSQTVSRFVSALGAENVGVTHSRLTKAERMTQWLKAKEGLISVMIGPRSALFTPFNNVGIIIADEEHDGSYKSETTPKYSAKEVAAEIGRLTGAKVVFGSATPDIETYSKALGGEYSLAVLSKRAAGAALPVVYVEDMRKELREGNFSVFSRELYSALNETLAKKEQAMLFLNRRGFSTFVSCRQCGKALMCSDCSVSYTYHSYENKMICHYCGKTAPVPSVCPSCGSKYIKYFGAGTQKIEEETNKLFPNAKTLRMDFDATTKKNSLERILNAFRGQEADILIGTQMIAKGHDFPNVTLVGVMAADLSLYSGSYKATETTFQLLTQVAGRAGRGENGGRVYIQTYNPDNYCVKYAAKQDYEGFYKEEIAFRKSLEYPPFADFYTILITGANEQNAAKAAFDMGEVFRRYGRNRDFKLFGPSPAAVSKIRKEYRWRISVKHSDKERLRNYVFYCLEKYEKYFGQNGVYINVTLNPVGII